MNTSLYISYIYYETDTTKNWITLDGMAIHVRK